MKIIDARSGQEMQIGQTISYPGGESVTLLEVEPGIWSARARARTVSRDWSRAADGPLVVREDWGPLQVRWTHPAFFLQHVAFFPS